jgi:segregation and condensation protein B
MNEFYIRNVLEAALLAAGKPLQLAEMSQLFDDTTRPKAEDIRAALDALANEYSNRGVEVKETAAGFRIQVRREFSGEVSRLWPERPVKYSRALLETLALIAYRQPITRAEIEAVRGVAVNPNIIKTVIERNWVRVVGHRDVPGRPELLGTTREFLDYFGLRSLDELPPLAEIKSLGEYNPQLELPSSAVPALEGPAGDGVGANGAEGAAVGIAGVAVAGLLTSEAGMPPAVTSDGLPSGADSSDTAASDASSVVAPEAIAPDAVVSDAAASNADAGPGAHRSHGTSSDALASGDDSSGLGHSDGTSSDATLSRAVASVSASDMHHSDRNADEGNEEFSSAVDAVGIAGHAIIEGPAASEASALPAAASATTEDVAAQDVAPIAPHDGDHDTEIEAERMLAAGEGFEPHAAAEAEEAEASANTHSNDSFDVLDDSAEEDADEDELSADGDASRELVAGPRDLDD